MKRALTALTVWVAAAALSGCAGYRLGEVKPYILKDVHKIAVTTFKNDTYIPRIESLVTNTVIKQLQQDGTYKITSVADADAVLEGTVAGLGRAPARSLTGNVLATTEYNLNLRVNYALRSKDGRPLTSGVAAGSTSFFVSSDVNTDQQQAIPLAAEDVAVRLTSQLSEGW